MGTTMIPNDGSLLVGTVEDQTFLQFTGSTPEVYGRYIDEYIGVNSLS